jgi:NAD(P)H-dependent flavin oxidoreductase YrpB (nitropropane dioxygenase family)
MPANYADTAFTRAFGLTVPIVQGPMGGVSSPRFVASAAQAGALGMLPIWYLPPDAAKATVAQTRALTGKPFAVNIRADLELHDLIAIATDGGVDIVHLFWGDPARSMPTVRKAGARMIATVSDADTTKAALDAGADGLIAQGVEAGGHVFGSTPLMDLLAEVVALAAGVPVAAAGGLADADDIARVFELGASAAVLGTRLLVTDESDAHSAYKQALIDARPGDTVRTLCFDGGWPDAPHRVLRNSTLSAWEAAGRPQPGARPGEGDVVAQAPGGPAYARYHCMTPHEGAVGDIEAMSLYAGTGVGKVAMRQSMRAAIDEIMSGLNAAPNR